jgi:hypothetical protein
MKSTIVLFSLAMSAFGAFSQDELSPLEPAVCYKKMVLKDGKRYIGETEFGLPSGIGSIISEDGKTTTGYFQDGNFLGDFIVTPPWHQIDIEYYFDTVYTFNNFSIDLDILTPISDDSYLYIAPFGSSKLNDTPFYGGIQTHCGGYEGVDHIEKNLPFRELGRAMIFSRWEERRGEAISKAKGGVCESSGYEGDFISVRNTMDWSVGRYTFTLEKTKKTIEINDTLHTFVEMTVYDHQKQKTFTCGSLAFPGNELILNNQNYIFFELYSKRLSIKDVPYAKFQLSAFKVNGKAIPIGFSAAIYDKKYPKYANATFSNNAFTVEIGKPIYSPLQTAEEVYFEVLEEN